MLDNFGVSSSGSQEAYGARPMVQVRKAAR